MRLIDADDLIKELEEEAKSLEKEAFEIKENAVLKSNLKCRADGIRDALIEIIDAPTVETEQRWIPCSERLPEKGLRVLMQLNNAWQIVGWYDKEDEQWYALPFGQEVFNGCVLAWMPLPEDYEPQESEE